MAAGAANPKNEFSKHPINRGRRATARRNIAFNLEKAGFSVIKAFDGESGLAQALEFKPRLMILDVMLPHISGWDVCRALRASSTYGQDLPILMLTARGEARDREKSSAAGASDYLVKPFAMQELLSRIHNLLNDDETNP